MPNARKLIHPKAIIALKDSGFKQKEINWIAVLIRRHDYLANVAAKIHYHKQEEHAIEFIIKEATGCKVSELLTGVFENDSTP